MCNMAVESGAKNGIMEPNTATLNYLKNRGVSSFEVFRSDENSEYEKRILF